MRTRVRKDCRVGLTLDDWMREASDCDILFKLLEDMLGSLLIVVTEMMMVEAYADELRGGNVKEVYGLLTQ